MVWIFAWPPIDGGGCDLVSLRRSIGSVSRFRWSCDGDSLTDSLEWWIKGRMSKDSSRFLRFL